jgi:hypothetical protein
MTQTPPRAPEGPLQNPALLGGLAGLTAAVLCLSGRFGSALAPLLLALSPLPLFLAALGWGLRTGLFATVSFSLIMALTLPTALALAPALWLALPVFWLSRLALLRRPVNPDQPDSPTEWYPLGRLLAWTAGLGIAGFLAGEALTFLTTGESLRALFASLLDQIFTPEARTAVVAQSRAADWPTLRGVFAALMPAAGGLYWQLLIIANLVAASAILTRTGRSLRPGFGWRSLTLPRLLAPLLLLSVLLMLAVPATSYWAGTIAVQLFLPYFFLGLTVLHAIPIAGPGRALLLGLFYLLMLFQAWPTLIVAALGLGEQWFGLRARMAARAGREKR